MVSCTCSGESHMLAVLPATSEWPSREPSMERPPLEPGRAAPAYSSMTLCAHMRLLCQPVCQMQPLSGSTCIRQSCSP